MTAAQASAPFHSSVRTAVSTNTDMETGLQARALTTSRLEMAWVAGELVIRCAVSRVTAEQPRQEQAKRAALVRREMAMRAMRRRG